MGDDVLGSPALATRSGVDSVVKDARALWDYVTDSPGVTLDLTQRQIPPYDAHGRMLWLIWTCATAGAGEEVGKQVLDALPKLLSEQADLLLGVIEGGSAEITKRLIGVVQTGLGAVKAAATFYAAVYNATVWQDLVTAYASGDVGSAVEDIRKQCPAFFAAVQDLISASGHVQDAIAAWTSQDVANGAYSAIDLIGTFALSMIEPLGHALATVWSGVLEAINGARKYRAAGRLIGSGLVATVIEAWLLCDSLGVSSGAEKLSAHVADSTVEGLLAEGSDAVAQVVAVADSAAVAIPPPVVAKLKAAGYNRMPSLKGIGVRRAAHDLELYAQVNNVANKIGAYRDVSKVTLAFNAGLRALYGVGTSDLEFVVVRLDAHHIIEWDFLKPHLTEVTQKLGWATKPDADCLALLYEEHILGVPGKTSRALTPAQPSLTTRLTGSVTQSKPQTLLDVVDAHYQWYLNPKSATLAGQYYGGEQLRQVEAWFDEIYLKLGTVSPPKRPGI